MSFCNNYILESLSVPPVFIDSIYFFSYNLDTKYINFINTYSFYRTRIQIYIQNIMLHIFLIDYKM